MTSKNLIFLILFLLSMGFFLSSVRRILTFLRLGKPENRFNEPWKRIRKVLVVAFGQSKLLREPLAGVMHFLIFWGFVILLSAIVESVVEGLIPGMSIPKIAGSGYAAFAFMQDLFSGLVIVAVVLALFRRFVLRPSRLKLDLHSTLDATGILVAIFLIMISMLGQNATRMLSGETDLTSARFLSAIMMPFFASSGPQSVQTWFEVFWWIHIVLVLAFLNYLPYSKHLHVLTSIPNVYFSKLTERGALKPIDLEAENVETFGAADVDGLTWKQLLDGYTCTECGRCSSVCPAHTTGKLLSPRKIVMDIRDRVFEKGALLADHGKHGPAGEGKKGQQEKRLIHDFISPEELWACTTCMACVQECPVNIEHVDSIVDMRRNLVLMESSFPPEVQSVFRNLETNFTPWAFGASGRADWAEGLNVPRMADSPEVDVLFWVGCAGSYDARYKKVSRAFATLMNQAGVRFAILGTEEKCSGDPARRIGNEYLAQILMKDNIQTLNKYHVKKIVTSCPHCFNTLKNEYPQFGGMYEVVHHTDFLMGLVRDGKIKISTAKKARIVYHDSCYLGRYNEVYDTPRETLKSIPGIELAEMKRSRDRGFCCGAGGGRMFMEEHEGKRVNIDRTEEALELQPNVIGTACPFCMTMMTDGVKAKEAQEETEVKDIAEILLEATHSGKPVETVQ